MRLNLDCIRDLLFTIEELSTPNSFITSTRLSELENLSKYSYDEIIYHLRQLDWDGYIVTSNKNKSLDGIFFVIDLSPIGHEFISNIRKDTNWSKVKSISKEAGTSALTSLKTIAENVVASAIKASIGIN